MLTTTADVTDQEWQKTKLSLERPYKDDAGNLIPTLLDITLDGQFIYEPREEPDAEIGERFRRIFIERGVDFFDLDAESRYKSKDGKENGADDDGTPEKDIDNAEEAVKKGDGEPHPMSPEELFKMREELIQRLQ